MVRSNAANIRAVTGKLVRFAAIVLWVLYTLDGFRLFEPVAGFVVKLFKFKIPLGSLSFSPLSIVSVVIAVWVIFKISRLVRFVLETDVMSRVDLPRGVPGTISKITHYLILLIGFFVVVGMLGLDLGKLAIIAGALSVGIGFGLQSIVSNFVSGLILLAERPIRVGDLVVVKNEEGFVRRISVRATEIETYDRASVIVPNSEFITGVVKNWTHANTLGRVILKVRVGYGSNVAQVRDALAACAREHPLVLRSPPPGVYLMAFGDIGLDFELRCILANVEHALTVKSDLHVAVLERFRAAGIRISYPAHEERVPGLDPSFEAPR
jgi:small-conductance mechanosensitive channel